jgi:hypothetical protein
LVNTNEVLKSERDQIKFQIYLQNKESEPLIKKNAEIRDEKRSFKQMMDFEANIEKNKIQSQMNSLEVLYDQNKKQHEKFLRENNLLQK